MPDGYFFKVKALRFQSYLLSYILNIQKKFFFEDLDLKPEKP